ncbi:exosome complex exonuclease RRP44-like protein Dis3 [Oratosquilla oratoria]|uniref:exosome complex exonuclease RRP44-like protein Dis3 n=1 Tax=Oratosquilla oratoria TaxID=337810 RepID=UPI003F775349
MGIQERKLKIFYRKTKKGNIIKVVREHYLRDDVYCGLEGCGQCEGDNRPLEIVTHSESSLMKTGHLLFIDTNVALHQIDVLSHEAIKNVVVPQTVIEEVKHRSLPVYKRLRDLIETSSKHFYVFTNEHHGDCYVEREVKESVNDRNDRAIRVACWWYKQHLWMNNMGVVLLTNDKLNCDSARAMELEAYTVLEYVSSLTNVVGLLDMVAQSDDKDEDNEVDDRCLYMPHWSMEKMRSSIKSGKAHQGVLKTSRNNYLEANVMVQGFDKAVLIQGRNNLNRSLHDDVVAVEIFPKEQWSAPSTVVIDQEKEEEEKDENAAEVNELEKEKAMLEEGQGSGEKQPTGRVVGVIRRKWRQYCGIIKRNEITDSLRHLFVPADKRIPFIAIETRQAEALHNKRLIVAIDSWPRQSRNPKGHFVRVLGTIGDKDTENEVVLLEHDCPHTRFSESVLKCLPKMPWIITEKDEEERENLRHIDVCSVDPPGCTDIDDALHCRVLPNGNYEVGVHIADVSHFIRPGTALDKEAQHRSTTVYLTSRRIDMVPDLLSSNLCSLRGEVDRFAFSVMWEVNPEAEVLSSRFRKTIIKSRGELSYQEAQQRIDDPAMNDDLTISLRNLNMLAKKLKQKRIDDGALVLASMEVKFHIDPDTDTVVDIVAKQHLETMSMVEEFMLLANVTAAETTLQHFPSCALLRRHPAPPASNFDPLLLAAKSQGIELNTSSNKSLAESLNHATKDDNPFFNSMLRIMTTRCMMQALYFCTGTLEPPEYYHYGLATPTYTHFTSPIRRYADIIVHRLLGVIIEADSTYADLLDPKKCADLAQHINYRHKMAQYAGRASNVITAIASLRGKVSEYDAYILFLHKNAIQVLVPTIGQQLTLYLDQKPKKADKNKKNSKKMEVDGEEKEEEKYPKFVFDDQDLSITCGSLVFRPFDHVRIQVSIDSSDVQHQKVVTKLVHPFIPNFSVPSQKREADDDTDNVDPKKAKV